MAAYIAFGVEARHLLTAVIMTAPGTIMLAKMFVPETGSPRRPAPSRSKIERTDVNIIDAAARGTGEGLHLALNVGAHADFIPGAHRTAERRARLSAAWRGPH